MAGVKGQIHRGGGCRLYAWQMRERFWAKVNQTSSCWLWTGAKSDGYGTLWTGRGHVKAHRFSYEVHVGRISEGLEIDHVCRNPACVNPAHLEPVTKDENMARTRREACANGHEFTLENTYIRGDGGRFCRECGRRRHKEYLTRKKAKEAVSV